jgi:hypothetical protein
MVLDGRFDHNPDEADTGNIERQKIRESCKRKVKEDFKNAYCPTWSSILERKK